MSKEDLDCLWEGMDSVWQWLDPKQTYYQYQYSTASSHVDGNQQDGLSVSSPIEAQGSYSPPNQVNNTLNKTCDVDDMRERDCSGWEDNFDSVMQWFDSQDKNTSSHKKSASKSPKHSSSKRNESHCFRYVFLLEQYDKWCNVDGWNDEWGKFGGGYDEEKADPVPVPSKKCIQPSVPFDDYYNLPEGAGAELYSSSLTDPGNYDPYYMTKGQGWDQRTGQDWSENAGCSWPVGSWDYAQYSQYQGSCAKPSSGHNDFSLNLPKGTGSSERNQKHDCSKNAVNEKNKNSVEVENKKSEKAESVPPKKKKKKSKKKKKPQSNHQLEQNDFGQVHGPPTQDWCEQAANHYAWDRWSRLELLHYHHDLYWQNLPNQYEQLYYEDALLRKEEEEFWKQEMLARSADRQFYNSPNYNAAFVTKQEPFTNSGIMNDDENYVFDPSYTELPSTTY